MNKYAIYKYVFSKSQEKGSMFNNNGESAIEKAQDVLESMLQVKELKIYTTKSDGEVEMYPNHVFRNFGGVTVLKVCKVKYLKRYKDFQEILDETDPWCNVVIDNREGICQIAIEKSGAFDGHPDTVKDLLQETLGRQLAEYGICIDMAAKVRTAEFWDFVNEQCNDQHDTISRILLEFPNPQNVWPIDAPKQACRKLEIMSSLICAVGAVKGSLRLDASKEKTLLLDRQHQDLAEIVSLCCSNGYSIAVYFRDLGIYRYHDEVRAVYKIEDHVTDDFVNGMMMTEDGTTEGTFELIQWLDRIRETIKDYKDARPASKKRKGKGEKAVCA